MSRGYVRKYPRVGVSFPVECSVGGTTYRERASNLGGGGLLLGGLAEIAVGTTLALRFRPARHLPVMEAEARICYHDQKRGTAIEFTQISDENRQLLLRLIHHKTGDKRRFPRAPLATQIECNECSTLAFSRDVGLGGMFIETPDSLPIGSRLSLRFNLDDNGPVVLAVAKVTYYVEKMGVGVEFLDLSSEDQKRVETYVSRVRDSAVAQAETG